MTSVFRNRWWVVAASIVGLTVGTGSIKIFTFGVLLKPVSGEMHWGRSAMGAALLFGNILAMIASPLFGRAIDRWGVRRAALPMIAIFGLATVACAWLTPSKALLFTLFGLVGIAGVAQTPIVYSKIISAWFDRQRGLALGLAVGGAGVGATVLPAFTQYLIAHGGWRAAYVGLGLAILVLGLPAVGLFMREPPAAPDVQAKSPGDALPGLDLRQALVTPAFWILAVSFLLAVIAINGAIAHLGPIITDRGGKAKDAATILAASGPFLIVGRLLAGAAMDRIFAPWVAAAALAFPLAGLALIHGGGPSAAFAAAALLNIGVGAEVDTLAFLTGRYLGLRRFGVLYGALFAIFTLGSALGPYLMGVAYDQAHTYSGMLVALEVMLALGAVMLLFLGPYRYGQGAAGQAAPASLAEAVV